MLGKVSKARHAIVGLAVAGTSALAGFGVIGAGSHEERFDAKTIVVEPRPDDTIRVTEYVDQDFGHHARHGYERLIPNDFGVPTDVVAGSPDAPDDLSVVNEGRVTRIRIGDPDTTIKNQHRYALSYTYPDAMLSELGLLLDIVAPDGDGWPGDNETLGSRSSWSASNWAIPAAISAPAGRSVAAAWIGSPTASLRSTPSCWNHFPPSKACGSKVRSWRSPSSPRSRFRICPIAAPTTAIAWRWR